MRHIAGAIEILDLDMDVWWAVGMWEEEEEITL